MISIDIMILVIFIAALLFGFLIFSQPEDEEAHQYLWDEDIVDEDVVFRSGHKVLTYQMLEKGRVEVDFENIGRDYALEVAQHFYKKGLEARKKGTKEKAIDLFQQVHQISPKWLAPLHQLAELYLEKGEIDFAYESYEDLDILFPKGFKDTITGLFTLQLERKGEIPEDTFKRFKESLNFPQKSKLEILESLASELPNYAPTFLELARLSKDLDEKWRLITKGMTALADDETYQQLLIEKAKVDAAEGREYEAIYALGDLILNPETTTASTFSKANQVLFDIVSLEND